MKNFEKKIQYTFHAPALLDQALTHSSMNSEFPEKKSNETLEFLGDSVLQLIISEYLFENFPSFNEGELSKKRSSIVRAESLALAAKEIGLDEIIRLGRGELVSGGREKENILADGFEALCAAIYLDGGYQAAKALILNNLSFVIDGAMDGNLVYDYKSALQEACQKQNVSMPEYRLLTVEGPEHDATFWVGVSLDQKPLITGSGHNKKSAQQDAAKKALKELSQEVRGK